MTAGAAFISALLAGLTIICIFVLALRHVAIPQVLIDVTVGLVVGHFAIQTPGGATK